MRHRAWLIAIAVVVVIVGFVLYRKTAEPAAARASAPPSASVRAAGALDSAATAGAPRAPGAAPSHVTRFASPADRQAMADRIAAAREARAQQTPRPPPSLEGEPDDSHDLDHVAPKLKQALGEAIQFLAECYKTGSSVPRTAAVVLTLTADPEIGTLVGADQLLDEAGKPLDAELDSCLRTTLGSLQLPPLDATRDLHMMYSFKLDD